MGLNGQFFRMMGKLKCRGTIEILRTQRKFALACREIANFSFLSTLHIMLASLALFNSSVDCIDAHVYSWCSCWRIEFCDIM